MNEFMKTHSSQRSSLEHGMKEGFMPSQMDGVVNVVHKGWRTREVRGRHVVLNSGVKVGKSLDVRD